MSDFKLGCGGSVISVIIAYALYLWATSQGAGYELLATLTYWYCVLWCVCFVIGIGLLILCLTALAVIAALGVIAAIIKEVLK